MEPCRSGATERNILLLKIQCTLFEILKLQILNKLVMRNVRRCPNNLPPPGQFPPWVRVIDRVGIVQRVVGNILFETCKEQKHNFLWQQVATLFQSIMVSRSWSGLGSNKLRFGFAYPSSYSGCGRSNETSLIRAGG